MKYIVLIFSLLVASLVNAQGHYDGQMSLGINAGLQNNAATTINLNLQKLFKGNFFGLRGDLMFSNTKESINVIIPQQFALNTYNIGIAGFYTLERLIKYPFYINFFLGGNYTYEQLNNGNYETSQGIAFKGIQENVYGIYGGAEFEYMFTSNLSFVLTSLNQYQINSDLPKLRAFGLLGLKYSF